MPPTTGAFEPIVTSLDPPAFVVTTAARDQPDEVSGCLVGFATQCSIDPARFLVCLSRANHTYRIVESADAVAVHALRAGDGPVARLFGEETGDEVDKLERCTWSHGPLGMPVLDGLDWFVGRILDRLDLGDHVGLLLAPEAGAGSTGRVDEPQLGLARLSGLDAGHAASEA